MSRILTVAWRDFTQTVMRKVFLLAILGIPILMIGILAVAMVLMVSQEKPELTGTIAIVETTGAVGRAAAVEFDPETLAAARAKKAEEAQKLVEDMVRGEIPVAGTTPASVDMGEFGSAQVDVTIEMHEENSVTVFDSLRTRVQEGDLIGIAVIPAEVLEVPPAEADRGEWPKFKLYIGDDVIADHVSFIEQRVGQSVVRVRAERAGLDPDDAMRMLRRPRSETARVTESGDVTSEDRGAREIKKQLIPGIFMMLLWVAVFTSAQHLMMTTIEEKTSRVMEVLLSAVSPMQLMTGKILGQGFVGLLIITIYSSLAVIPLIVLGKMNFIDPWNIVYLFVYFFMAYFMIASLMAAVGSAVSDIREANTLVTPVMLVVMIPLILWMPISQDPNGPIGAVFSFLPPAIPFIMILRLSADEPVPIWQIPATIIWGYACVVGMIWMAAKIFRVGVLMYGKPPSLFQLLKWVRYT